MVTYYIKRSFCLLDVDGIFHQSMLIDLMLFSLFDSFLLVHGLSTYELMRNYVFLSQHHFKRVFHNSSVTVYGCCLDHCYKYLVLK